MTTAQTTRSGPSASDNSRSPTQELKADADRLKESAKDRATEEAGKRKRQASIAARSTADAIQKAASHLENDDRAPSWLASAFREAASGVDKLADKADSRSPEQMGDDVNRFAREHPTTFLAASAAAGFAAARFLRAGADYKHHESERHDAYRGESTRDYAGGDSLSQVGGRFENETRAAQQRLDESRGGMTQ